MDSSRTRFVLRAMRPNGADHADPTFSEALEQTHADPELRTWFEREQAVDRALTAKLREVRAPAELRAQILQGLALSRDPRPSSNLRRPLALFAAGLAAAASIVLVLYTMLPRSRPELPAFDLFVTAAVNDTIQPPTLAPDTASAVAAAAWLKQSNLPALGELPGTLDQQPVVGAGLAEWHGVRCSRVTFRMPQLAGSSGAGSAGPDLTLIHVYAVPRNSCSTGGIGRTPVIAERDSATIATWRDATNNYVLVTRASRETLLPLLGTEARIAIAGGWIPVVSPAG